jgi:signal transduction histidine kinase
MASAALAAKPEGNPYVSRRADRRTPRTVKREMKVSVTAIAATSFAAIALAGCAAIGQIATRVSSLSSAATGGGRLAFQRPRTWPRRKKLLSEAPRAFASNPNPRDGGMSNCTSTDPRPLQVLAHSNIQLDEFAYIASHDLKALLRVIDNTSKWLEEDLKEHLSGENRENMNLLRRRVHRMETLLDDLLEYSRIGRTEDDRYRETLPGDALMTDILGLISPPEGFKVVVSAALANIHVRRMPLQQILMNLISNAIKHHDKRQGVIEVTVQDAEPDYVFVVRDDGPGIPERFHEQIFKMFQTLKPRDQVEGSGMGLAMVRKNIEIFGGKIHLDSAEGRGSAFRFTWPKQQRLK